MSRTARRNIATVKPTPPLHAPNKGPLKPPSPLRRRTAPKMPISRPQRRWRFHPHALTSEQRRQGFQTTGPPRLRHPDAARVGGSWLRHPWAATNRQPNLARNFPRSIFEMLQKRCNSNDMNSKFELIAGELRATLLGNQHDWKPTHETTYQHTRRRCERCRRDHRAPEEPEGLAAPPTGT